MKTKIFLICAVLGAIVAHFAINAKGIGEAPKAQIFAAEDVSAVDEIAAEIVFCNFKKAEFNSLIPPTILDRLIHGTHTTDDLVDVVYIWAYMSNDKISQTIYNDSSWHDFVEVVYPTSYNNIFDFDL